MEHVVPNIDTKTRTINVKGARVYLAPSKEFEYTTIINRAITGNTYRAFHKRERGQRGPKEILTDFLISKREEIVEKLINVRNAKALDTYLDQLADKLRRNMAPHIKAGQLESYNKLRKLLDVIVVHLVTLYKDFKPWREKLIPLLFLPLDSQMFQSCYVFTDEEILKLKLKRTFDFKDIREKEHYKTIQKFLSKKAKSKGLTHRIYFDLIWGQRYTKAGNHLFAFN